MNLYILHHNLIKEFQIQKNLIESGNSHTKHKTRSCAKGGQKKLSFH